MPYRDSQNVQVRMMAQDPIFIGGMYKSGTSLLRAMLSRHSHLFAGLETQWLHEDWGRDSARRRRAWLERMATFYDSSFHELETVCRGAEDVETCLDRMMAFFTTRAGKRRWAEKTPGNSGEIARILARWPTACFLHIVRDPRDVYASHVENKKWHAPAEFARRWSATVGAARDWLAEQDGEHPAYYELRYEQLVQDPERAMRNVLVYLDEPWETQVASFDGEANDFERVLRATGKESPTLKRLAQPLTNTRVGVWRSVLGSQVWNEARAMLEQNGYGEIVEEIIVKTELICENSS